ncbi:dynein heavy chain, partial [Spiromyces aspiralis]
MSDLTLGHIWDFDLVANEKTVRDVIIVAQGEMGLEEFLKQVKETWTSYVLELVPYQNKCRLIKGWDELFAKCSEQLNALTAMKASPYYKVFEEEAAAWEERLTRVHVLFDVWIDVQRQWVYLEGIFTGSADIKHLLPVESSRFQNINTEFLAVMKRVYKSPYTLDVLNLPNIQRSLERLADLLSKIQKALGEYLERERSSFPRFYFVGDEDLLEIIGNAKDVSRIQKHLKKMFAGIALIHMNEDEKEILGMISKEGERVDFRRPVSLRNSPKINEWLGMLESEMRLTLAHLLASAVDDLEGIVASGANINADVFLSWVERYPSQLVVLAMQINWTRVTEAALSQDSEGSASALSPVLALVERGLDVLAHAVLRSELQPLTRKKCEHLITELVHQRDVVRSLADAKAKSSSDFVWLYHMRFYFSSAPTDNPLERLDIRMADGSFLYGYEYLGVPDRLVQTPLTDKCYLTLTQALQVKLGGSPFGPAGTGKCWAKGTMILMADGSEKPVEDIAEGDVVMGDDCHGRTVGAVTAGTGPMYQIVPCSRYAEEFECNGAHILVLRWAADALMTSMVADRGCSVQATWFEYCSAENMIYRRSAMFDSEAAAQLFVRSGQAASLVGPGFIWEVPLTTYLRADRSVQERCVMYRADAVVRRVSEGIVRKFIAEQPEVAPEAADELVKSVAWTLGYYLAMSNIDENDGPDRLTGISQMAKVESL